MDSIFEPFLLSLIAGMATGLGGMIVLMLRRVGDRVVSFSIAKLDNARCRGKIPIRGVESSSC
jgi:hypothetical protein